MKRLISATLTALALVVLMAMPTLGTHRNCPEFDTHAQAQRYFENANHETSDLDADNDGDACEGLPGYKSGGNGNGNGDDEGDNGGDDGDDDGNGADPGDMPDSSTTSPAGAPLPLLLSAFGLGTFGLMLRRRFSLQS